MHCQLVIPSALRLQISDIKKEFVGFFNDLNEGAVLDCIDRLEDESGFRIRSHDALGVLPDIVVQETGNRYEERHRLHTNIVKLAGTVRARRRESEATVPAAASVVAAAKAGRARFFWWRTASLAPSLVPSTRTRKSGVWGVLNLSNSQQER